MPELHRLQRWLKDLTNILIEQDMLEDGQVQRNLALIELELEGLNINLPGTSAELAQLLFAAHESRISALMVETLQHSLGYYFLPLRAAGENEPAIGPEDSYRLRAALQQNEIDIYDVKQRLANLLQPASSVKTVIFDLDGTLLDTLQSLASCYNRILSKHGFKTHETNAYRFFIGNGARQCLMACLRASGELEGLPEDEIEVLLQDQRKDYEANWDREVTVYAGIPQLIEQLARVGFELAVLTNKDHDFAQACVQYFFPDHPFSVIQGFEPGIPHKPDPSGASAIAQKCGCSVAEMILIGDTRVDIETAAVAGMKSIGVLWGFRDRQELEAAGADYIVTEPDEVLSLLETKNPQDD